MINIQKKIKMKLEKGNLLKQLYEILRYGIVGICTTLINTSIYRFFSHNLSFNYLYANLIAWTIAVIFAFFANKFIVFRRMDIKLNILISEFISFIGSRAFTGILDMIFMYIGVSIFHYDDFFVKIIVNIFIILLNYILGKFFVFKNNE